MSQDVQTAVEVLRNRTESYRLFSRLFLKPLSAEEVESLANMKLEETAQGIEDSGLLAEGFNDMGRGLHRRHSGTARLLSTDFTMCFDGVSSCDGLVAVPYASIYNGSITGDKAILFQEPRTNDLAAYRSESIEVDPSFHLPEDHLSFELSFLADLSDKAAAALEEDDAAEALRVLEASRSFIEDNVLSWYGKFYERALGIIETRFYRGVLKATYGYLQLDETTIDDLGDMLS